jgi:Rrf2 family protein
MMITSKSRYALKVMMDLAMHQEKDLEQRHDIAARQGIPLDYLDQILLRLRAGGLIESVRGRSGGFKLIIAPKDITVWDILNASEESLYPVQCLTEFTNQSEACVASDLCSTRGPWEEIISSVRQRLTEISLASLVEKGVIVRAVTSMKTSNVGAPKKAASIRAQRRMGPPNIPSIRRWK